MGDTDVDLYGEDLPEETGKSDSFKPFDVFSYKINDLFFQHFLNQPRPFFRICRW